MTVATMAAAVDAATKVLLQRLNTARHRAREALHVVRLASEYFQALPNEPGNGISQIQTSKLDVHYCAGIAKQGSGISLSW